MVPLQCLQVALSLTCVVLYWTCKFTHCKLENNLLYWTLFINSCLKNPIFFVTVCINLILRYIMFLSYSPPTRIECIYRSQDWNSSNTMEMVYRMNTLLKYQWPTHPPWSDCCQDSPTWGQIMYTRPTDISWWYIKLNS